MNYRLLCLTPFFLFCFVPLASADFSDANDLLTTNSYKNLVLSAPDPLIISNETYDLGGSTQVVGDVTMFNATVINGTLVSDSSFMAIGGSNTISASLAGLAFFYTTAGTTILSGSNSYSGGTFLDGGTLILTNDGTLGDPNNTLSISNDALLDLGGTTQNVGNVYFNGATLINGTLHSDAGFVGLSEPNLIGASLSGAGGVTVTPN